MKLVSAVCMQQFYLFYWLLGYSSACSIDFLCFPAVNGCGLIMSLWLDGEDFYYTSNKLFYNNKVCFLFVNKAWPITMQSGHSTIELNQIKHSTCDFYLIPCIQQGQDTRTFKRHSFTPFMIPWVLINMKKLVVTNLIYSWSILSLSLYMGLRVFFCQFFCFVSHEVLYLLRNFNYVTKLHHLWK